MTEKIDKSIKNKGLSIGSISKLLPTREALENKHKLFNSWGSTSHPDECYGQGLEDMYNAILKELNEL